MATPVWSHLTFPTRAVVAVGLRFVGDMTMPLACLAYFNFNTACRREAKTYVEPPYQMVNGMHLTSLYGQIG